MEDSTTSPVENTEQKSIELEQPQEQTQVSQVEETKVENVCPTVATDNTFITPDPGSEAIPLPYIETSGVSEQNFITEDAEPITNAEDTNYPEENSKDECMPLSVAPSEETNSNMENQPTEKQEGEKVSENVIQAELQEKQASVELQDLDYWELEDDENNMISSEQKQLDSSENIQRVPLESPMENFTVQEFSFPETRVAVGHSDTKPEEAEKTLQYEQQQMEEEIAGTSNWENIKDAYEENEQNSQPLSLPITSPLSESHVTPTDNFDEGKESSTPNFGTSASNDAQESHILQESDNPSLFTEEGFPEQSASYSLTSNDKNEDFGWNESEVSDLKTNEMENSLYNGKEKEKNDQDTVEMEKVETDKGNEPSSMQEDSVKEELLSNQQQQEESKQTESKVVSLGVSSFNNTFESRARLHMLGESQYKEKGWGHVKLQKLADNTASKLTFSVEPSVNIFESNIDTDTKFQRVRAKSVRISGSKEQGKDDFVLQLPDTQIAEELVEFLTVTIEEQTKKGSLESSADGDLSTSRTSSLENQILAQKQAEMERVRQHIAELEKRKALVRQSLQRKAVNSQKTSPVATSTPDSPTVAKLNTMDTPSSVSIPETILHANSSQEEASQPREHREMGQRTDEGVVQRILEQGHENIPVEPKSYEGITVGQEPESMQLESPISKRDIEFSHSSSQGQDAKYSSSEQVSLQNFNQARVEMVDRRSSISQEEFANAMEQIRKLEQNVREQMDSTKSTLALCLKREELDSALNKLMQLVATEAESRISLLLSEVDGIIKLLDKNKDDGHSEAFKCCRPWSLSDFFARLHTFRPSTWPAKPESIDAVECARRGWRNAGFNLLECEGKFIYFDENAANYWEEVENVRKKITGRGYRFMSPWIGNPCPETFRQVPWSIVSHTIERAKQLKDLELSVQLESSCIECLQGELEMFSKPRMEDIVQFFALDDERKRNSFFLGIFGWTVEPLLRYFDASRYETCLHCEYCDIRIVLDSSIDAKFHAEKEHRCYCAFHRGGWKSCLEYLRQYLISGTQVKIGEQGERNSGVKRIREEEEEVVPIDVTCEANTELAT